MTAEAANAFIDHLETDPALVGRIDAVRAHPTAVLAIVRNAGFDVAAEDIRDAFGERFGDQLGEAELEQLAGGLSPDVAVNIALFLAGNPAQPAAFSAAAAS